MRKMKISTKGRYALRMMLDLAEHQGDGCVALKDIAKRQNISVLSLCSLGQGNIGYRNIKSSHRPTPQELNIDYPKPAFPQFPACSDFIITTVYKSQAAVRVNRRFSA